MTIQLESLQNDSIFFFIKDLFQGENIKVVDGFPTTKLEIPSIAVDTNSISIRPFEFGNRIGYQIKVITIDIFASNKTQRDGIAYKILNKIQENIPVYDYNYGFPPENNPPQIGIIIPENIKLEIIKVNPEFVDILYYRASISFEATYSAI